VALAESIRLVVPLHIKHIAELSFDLLPKPKIPAGCFTRSCTITTWLSNKKGLWYTNGGEALDATALIDIALVNPLLAAP